MFDIDVTHNIVREQADHAAVLMDGVASGRKPMQLIHSPSGFAKTAIAMKRFRAHGIVLPRSDGLALKPWQRMVLEARPTAAIVLVRKLFECVQRNAAVLLLDDPGKIAHDEDSLDVLKTGFGAQRTVMLETPQIVQNELWRLAGHASYNALIPPPRFGTRDLRFLWLSNTDFTDPKLRKMIAEHFDPLVARGLNPFRITDDAEHDNQAVFEWVLWLVTVKNLLRNLGFSYNDSRSAVNFYISNAHRLYRSVAAPDGVARKPIPRESPTTDAGDRTRFPSVKDRSAAQAEGALVGSALASDTVQYRPIGGTGGTTKTQATPSEGAGYRTTSADTERTGDCGIRRGCRADHPNMPAGRRTDRSLPYSRQRSSRG